MARRWIRLLSGFRPGFKHPAAPSVVYLLRFIVLCTESIQTRQVGVRKTILSLILSFMLFAVWHALQKARAVLLTGVVLCFTVLPQGKAQQQVQKNIPATSQRQIIAAYQLVKDSLLTLPIQPFTLSSAVYTEQAFREARRQIWKGNLLQVRAWLLQALRQEQVLNTPSLHVAAQCVWVDYLISVDSFNLAFSNAQKLASLANSAQTGNAGQAYLALARAASFVNESYSVAYKNVEKARAVAAATNNVQLEGEAQLVAGTLARKYFYGSTGRSIQYYDKAIAAATRAADTPTLIKSLRLKQADLGEPDIKKNGIPYLKEAIQLAIRFKGRKFTSNLCESLFARLNEIEEGGKGVEMLLYALEATRRFGMLQSENHMYMQLSDVYSSRQLYDSSLYYLNLSTPNTTMVPGAKTPSFFKASVYYRMGRYKQAATLYHYGIEEYLNAYVVHGQDELNRWETTLRTQEKEQQLQQNAAKRRQLNWIIAGVLAILAVTLVALLWQRALRRKVAAQNRLISRQSQRLQQSLAEKEMLLKEIHHRVKNNLQVIDSLLDMHQGNSSTGLPASQQDSFIKARTHVHTISMIHQNLYQQDHLSSVAMRSFVNELFTQTEKIFNKTGRAVLLNNQVAEEIKLDVDTAVPLGLILNELLTNAFKYVLPVVNELHLSLSIAATGQPTHYVMQYHDNGPGLPAGFDVKRGGSMGMQLIRQLSRQVRGKADYAFENGSRFIIHFLTLEGRKQMD